MDEGLVVDPFACGTDAFSSEDVCQRISEQAKESACHGTAERVAFIDPKLVWLGESDHHSGPLIWRQQDNSVCFGDVLIGPLCSGWEGVDEGADGGECSPGAWEGIRIQCVVDGLDDWIVSRESQVLYETEFTWLSGLRHHGE